VKRILIIDDDEAMRTVLREFLEKSYEVIDTGDPEQAVTLALREKPDAILLDLMMPKFSGFELCQTFTSFTLTQQIPIFIISGEDAAKCRGFCQNLGAAGYFEKPVDLSQLRATLGAALKSERVDRRLEVRLRLSVTLKLRGKDRYGVAFELRTTSEKISANGFLCGCPAALEKGSTVDVSICQEIERYVGSARVVRVESPNTPHSRYGFRFVDKPLEWVLQ
jgi:DNA-binding response OmpR family regulator